MTVINFIQEWGLFLVDCLFATIPAAIGLFILWTSFMQIITLTRGRRTPAGRRRLDLIRLARKTTRTIDENREKEYLGYYRGIQVNAYLRGERDITPLTTPMARELASWHGLEYVHELGDIRIGTYPIYFHDSTR